MLITSSVKSRLSTLSYMLIDWESISWVQAAPPTDFYGTSCWLNLSSFLSSALAVDFKGLKTFTIFRRCPSAFKSLISVNFLAELPLSDWLPKTSFCSSLLHTVELALSNTTLLYAYDFEIPFDWGSTFIKLLSFLITLKLGWYLTMKHFINL